MAAFMAASPAPTRPPDLAEWANSRLYKIAHPAIFWCSHARKQARIPVNTAEDSLAPRLKIDFRSPMAR